MVYFILPRAHGEVQKVNKCCRNKKLNKILSTVPAFGGLPQVKHKKTYFVSDL